MFDQLSDDQMQRLVYLSILLVALGGYGLVASRGQIATRLRHLVLWALLFTGVGAGYALWEGIGMNATVHSSTAGEVVVRRGPDGHFHLSLAITGPTGRPETLRFIVDTGASDMVLTRADAARLGFGPSDLRWLGRASTANGTTRTATVVLDHVALAGHSARQVRALVNEGELHASLLGMGYLERFASLEITRDRLRIRF